MRVEKPGLYTMPLADYIADPCPEPSLSASIAHKLITESPIHAKMYHPRLNPNVPKEESGRADIGTIVHALLLEKDESRLVIIDHEDWRTNAAKAARDVAYSEGKIPILKKQMGPIRLMVETAQSAIKHSELAGAFKDGTPEQTMVWQEGDIWLRSRPDFLTNDHELIIDLKTTSGSAEPTAWIKTMLGNGADLQCALGIRGLRHLFNAKDPKFIFMCQEQDPPFAVSFVGLSPQFLEMSEHKLQRAIQLWGDCTLTNTWGGYPSRICWADPPAYLWTQEMEGRPL